MEYEALSTEEWRKDYFCEETGGFVATHVLKTKDDMTVPGIVAEVKACFELAKIGKRILRLPENIPDLIDVITIKGKPYHELLKFKQGETHPRGYPDAYFDGLTWDFKVSRSKKEDTLRQLIKDGRKADAVVFITTDEATNTRIRHALEREIGRRLKTGTWKELPDVYCMAGSNLLKVWNK